MRDMNFCSRSKVRTRSNVQMVMYFRTLPSKKVTTFSDFASFLKCLLTLPNLSWSLVVGYTLHNKLYSYSALVT